LCSTTTYDPDTLAHDPAFLKFAFKKYNAKFGLFCKVIAPGLVREGDSWATAS
jgi:MOSC domain-containing protein YiiM